MKGRCEEIEEEICVERFLNWYNKQHNKNYICERAEDHFTELRSKPRWDFVDYEPDNPEACIGIEVKELDIGRETSISFTFWRRLCSDLTKYLLGKGTQGEFEIIFPPVFQLPSNKRQGFLESISQILIDEQTGWQVGESKDISSDVASRFLNWPTEKSEPFDEYDKYGTYRPSELQIKKVSDSGCKVNVVTRPVILFDVKEEHDKALNEVFKLDNDRMHSDRQLELAKQKGASKTTLLLAGIGADEGLTKDYIQNLNRHLISHIDCIYLVDMGDNDSVVKIYPS